MVKLPLVPIKVLGGIAAGVALYGGWKLGEYLGDVATGKKELKLPDLSDLAAKMKRGEPLWKREFTQFSET